MSPSRTPATDSSALNSGSAAANPGNISTPRASACCAIQGVSWPSETMKLPWLCNCGGVGSFMLPVRVRNRNSSRLAGTQIAGGDCRHCGSSASSGPGSMTAPESACAPMAEAFSSTQMLVSGLSCLSRIAQARPAGPPPTMAMSYSMTSRSTALLFTAALLTMKGSSSLLRLHTDRAIEADRFAIQHRDFEYGGDELGKLRRLSQSRRKRDLAGERGLQFLRHRIHHRGVEDARRDRHAANAEPGKLASDRQRHAGQGCLRGGVGRLANLAFERRYRGGVDEQPALAVGGGRIVLHDRSSRLIAEESADEVDVHDLREEVPGHRAVLAEHATGADDAGAIHEQVDAVHVSARAFHGRIHFGLGGHVTTDEQGIRAKSSRSRAARSLLYVQNDDLAALRHDVLGHRVTQAGSAACYDGACILNLHWSPLETPYPIISTASATASPPPMHKEAIPRCSPRRRRAYSRVVRMRAPVAPMG